MSKPFSSILSLFNEAKMLDKEHVAAVLAECSKRQITPGEFLYSSGAMKPEVIRGAILAQLLINDRLLPNSIAVQAIQSMAANNCSFEEALERCEWDKRYAEHIRLVSELTTASGCISPVQRDIALDSCLENHIPFTKILLEKRDITEFTADFILAVEVLLHQEIVSFEQGVQLIARSRQKNVTLEEALEALAISVPPNAKSLKLGELLLASGHVSARQLMASIEQGLFRRTRLGEILMAEGIIDERVLSAALKIQENIKFGLINASDGVSQLKLIESPTNSNSRAR
jgi:hypothetical protein